MTDIIAPEPEALPDGLHVVSVDVKNRGESHFREIGASAGATIQGSYLARGDTKTNTIMMGDHEEGLAFIKNVAIDQHLLKRNRHFDLIEIIQARPHLLGIGLDEDTAIVVRGDRFEVIGQSFVAIYDHNRTLDSGGQLRLPAALCRCLDGPGGLDL